MRQSSIPAARRLEYAQGFLSLGLAEEAAAELAALPESERSSDAALGLAVDVHVQREAWEIAARCAEQLARRYPDEPDGWISWAYAVRRWKSIPDAEQVLLEAERHVGRTCALVHYNLACYRCQLGDHAGALQRLALAFRLDPAWKKAALVDPDLAPIKGELSAVV